eukprot:GHVS01011288.1.p1 GENE.GHVS01011288.1~~GHVS01011288.1.p1  ORF type:complete len:232 (+),score=19.52 GHVS01011288.1:88-696(+)
MLVIDSILVSTCWRGSLRVWQFSQASQLFETKHTMDIPAQIVQMREVQVTTQPQAENGNRYLWLAGTSIVIIDLATMLIAKTIDLSAKVSMGLVETDGHMLVGFADGFIKVFTMLGEEMYTHHGDPLCSMDGMFGESSCLLVYGTNKGFIKSLKLPEFEDSGSIKGHEMTDVKVIRKLGPDHFLTAGRDGCLHIWMWIHDTP